MHVRTSQRYARYQFDQEVIQGVIEYAFKEKKTEKSRQLQNLIRYNAELLQTTPSFMYKETYYTLWFRCLYKG